MTSPTPARPSIAAAWARLTAEACKHSPGGVLLPADLTYLHRATARDAGVTRAEVRQWLRDAAADAKVSA